MLVKLLDMLVVNPEYIVNITIPNKIGIDEIIISYSNGIDKSIVTCLNEVDAKETLESFLEKIEKAQHGVS